MSEREAERSVLDEMAADALARFRTYLESEVDWTPLVPPADALSRDERWERICRLLLEQAETAGREALAGLATLRARDRRGELRDRLDLADYFVSDGDGAAMLTLFQGEHGERLIAMANEAFEEGSVADADRIFALAHAANPTRVEPLIGRLMVTWEQEGAERAAYVFEATAEVITNPLLYMFAADCLRTVGEGEKADALIDRALALLADDADMAAAYGDLEDELRAARGTTPLS